ncbi:MAG: hypothetical protein A4E66_02681 [Syntrophus sp. PtaB.Bin001]|nr:MAG: hypothetical protein A4E66_02681 [Syntrophus sp. PtaB.Bin001]
MGAGFQESLHQVGTAEYGFAPQHFEKRQGDIADKGEHLFKSLEKIQGRIGNPLQKRRGGLLPQYSRALIFGRCQIEKFGNSRGQA